MGRDTMIFVFWMLSFKPALWLSSFNFVKRLFSCSSLSALRVVSSAYLRLLIFLWVVLILSSVQSFSRVWLFTTPWITACQASLSITNSRVHSDSTSIQSVMPSRHLILCRPLLLLPSIFLIIKVFSVKQLFISGGQSIGPSASVLLKNIQGLFPLVLTGLISLQTKKLSRVFSDTTVQKR